MKIFIGADHRGFQLKDKIKKMLAKAGCEVIDVGVDREGVICDYPKISYQVASRVADSQNAKGILVCMTGIGHSIAANKVPGAYAALCYSKKAAVFSREHNNSNILVLGAKFTPASEIPLIVSAWLKTPFGGGRHLRRVGQIKKIERKLMRSK